ncbi:MAG: ribosome recycling factor [Deltaproteobacteria bacterium]|nr:ribosome recycling factor [Deltaproteobacteria bacterium]
MLDEILDDLKQSNVKAHEALKRELSRLRAGRASASMLDGVRVDYYGTPTPIGQMATVTVPEPRLIQIKVWERGQAKAVEKALRESDLNLNPQVDGDLLRIPLPSLTEERRKELAKLARKHGEECKIAIRKNRKEAKDMVDQLTKDGDVSEDDGDATWKKAEDLVALAVKHADEIVAAKEKDIMTV